MTVAPARPSRRALRGRRGWRQGRHRFTLATLTVTIAIVGPLELASGHPDVWGVLGATLAVVAAFVAYVCVRRVIRDGYACGSVTIADMLAMTPTGFEEFVARLCMRDGADKAEVVGGAGDRAADVLVTLPGRHRIVIQCKRYATAAVDSKTVHELNGTYRDWHGAQRAALVTTSRFTAGAREFADHVGIRLLAAADLEAWANGSGRPPWR